MGKIRQASRMDAIGQLAGGIAHDFNNLITVIRSHASLLQADMPDSRHLTDSAREIAQAADRAAGLTRQLLAFSQRHSFNPKPLDLNEVLGAGQKMIHRLVGDRVFVELQLSAQLPLIHADAALMDQAVVELVMNARDAMPDGGKLSISTSVVDVDSAAAGQFRGAYPGRFVRLSISDTGGGIPNSVLSRVFEPFVTTKDFGNGNGLGLATVYGIVLQHRGWIRLDTAADKGTTFGIHLPCAPAIAQPVEPASRPAASMRGSERILIVEDETMLRQVMSLLLRKQGYTVLEAGNAEEALEHWLGHKAQIDLVITDLSIPDGMSGSELAASLRADRPDIRIIFSSGYGAQAEVVSEKLVDGDNFLPKPYQSSDLARIVRRRLDAVAV